MNTAATTKDNSEVTFNKGGSITFEGKDAMALYRAILLKSHINLYLRCVMIPTRGVTITKMLGYASVICGQKFKRGQALLAIERLSIWIATMQAAIPMTDDDQEATS